MPVPSRPVIEANRLPGLDLIRGLAIGLVLLRHAWPSTFEGAGIVGVVIFFALSGYLITGLLQRDLEQSGRVRYGRFYLHRAFRLLPALFFALAGFALIEGTLNILGDQSEVLRTTIVGLTYTMNIPLFDRGSDAMRHLWTLATEEQFYLLWPLVFAFAFRRKVATKVGIMCVVGLFLTCAATIVLVQPAVFRVYELPTSWAAAMMFGALAKLQESRLDTVMTVVRARILGPVALGLLCVLSAAPVTKESPTTYLIAAPLVACLGLVLVFSVKGWSTLPHPALRPLQALGLVSYAAYLWNYPIVSWLGQESENFLLGSTGVLLTLAISVVSWFLVEKPAVALRRRIERKRAARTFENFSRARS